MRITVEQLADWVMENRRGRAFTSYTKEQICEEITEGIWAGTFVYHLEDEKILGLACGKKYQEEKVIWIHDVLTLRKDIIQKFLERFLLVYPDWTIKGQRNKRTRVISQPKQVLHKLMTYGQ